MGNHNSGPLVLTFGQGESVVPGEEDQCVEGEAQVLIQRA